MKLTVIEYGGEPRQIECESFEFRCVPNWIKTMHADGSEEMVHDVCVIKTEDEDPKAGHWIDIYKRNTNIVIAIRCPKCGESPKHAIRSRFCPNCGFRMIER